MLVSDDVMQVKPVCIPWEDRPLEDDSPVWRYSDNPIVSGNALSYANSIFNSGVARYKDQFVGVFRVDDQGFMRTLNVGWSSDGINWQLDPNPIIFTSSDEDMSGCVNPYDPRLIEIDGKYYIMWCNSEHGPSLSLGVTEDFEKFELLEPASLPLNRNGVLFPRKLNGKFVMLSRPSSNGHCVGGDIFYSESPDLEHWGHHRYVMGPEMGWSDTKVGAGPPPIETSEGWLVFFHGVKTFCSGMNYAMGVALLDLEKPWKVVARAQPCVLYPETDYERVGNVPNVIFPAGVLHEPNDGKIAIYYGAADTCIAVAFTTVDIMLEFIKNNS